MLRPLRYFLRRQEGSTAVEFGLILAPFLVLLFGAMQVFILLLAQQMLETAAEESGRLVLTGRAQTLNQTQFRQQICASIPALLKCSNLILDIQTASNFAGADTSTPTLTFDKNGNVTNAWKFDTGGSGDVVVMRLMYQWPIVNMMTFKIGNVSNNSRLLVATAVFRNEAF